MLSFHIYLLTIPLFSYHVRRTVFRFHWTWRTVLSLLLVYWGLFILRTLLDYFKSVASSFQVQGVVSGLERRSWCVVDWSWVVFVKFWWSGALSHVLNDRFDELYQNKLRILINSLIPRLLLNKWTNLKSRSKSNR